MKQLGVTARKWLSQDLKPGTQSVLLPLCSLGVLQALLLETLSSICQPFLFLHWISLGFPPG